MGEEGNSGRGRITEILEELRSDTPGARDELFHMVYGELRRLAGAQMRGQPAGHTLQPTALVHEAFLRLMGGDGVPWNGRAHFLSAAARSMRCILVDFARRRMTLKRGGDRHRVPLREAAHAGEHQPGDLIAVHEALERLEAVDPKASRVVELRFFGGLTVEETARVMEVAESTVYRIWEHARAWLFREISP